MNPSAAQLLSAVEELGVDEVVILPNNGNVILTAEQAAGMSSLHIAVVPSRSIPSGLAAMVAFDPGEDAVGNARLMQDAIVDVRYAEVTHAVRDSELDGLEVKQGQAMAIVDGRLVAASDDIESAFGGVLEEFARGGAEYVTCSRRSTGRARRASSSKSWPRASRPMPKSASTRAGSRSTRSLRAQNERRPMTLLTLENTAIVLDSTCDPADGWLDQPGLYMVPLKVHFGDQMFRDGIDMTYKEFFARLEQSEILPTTSQPTAGEFVATYEEARKHYEHVFSLHLSGEMSGTVRAAEQAAEQFDNVYVYDLRTVTSALSLGAERLRARLARGCTLEEARTYVEYFRDHSNLLVHAATLEYLRRGGRIGRAASLVGGVFDIKPLIIAVDGTLTGYAKVRGLKKALAAMQRFVEERSEPDDELYFCVIDAVNDEEPPLIREMIERIRPNAHYTFQGHVAAVVGTHIGPGTAAFAMIVE